MEKRVFLAIALSLIILLTWSAFISKSYHIDNNEVTNRVSDQEEPIVGTQEKADDEVLVPGNLFTLGRAEYQINFIEESASIESVIFKNHKDYLLELKSGFLISDKTITFKRDYKNENKISFVHKDPSRGLVKNFNFYKDNYTIELEIKTTNLTKESLSLDIPLILGDIDISSKNPDSRYLDLLVSQGGKEKHFNPKREAEYKDINFLGLRERYFCLIIEPDSNNNYYAYTKKINGNLIRIGLIPDKLILKPGETIVQKFHIYLGPQDLQIINSIRPKWSSIIHYGTFDFISQIILQLLMLIYKMVNNWGLAIIILSILIYILLYPLTLKQMHSMKEMQALQPKIEEIRNTYKDNPQKQNKEIMGLYKEHKVNPFGGCLPLLLQMPIFFALYQVLIRSVSLKGANFLWIKDLSEPDRVYLLGKALPIIGNEVNILPIIMALIMFFQQKISLATSSASSAEQQKMMVVIFPILFGVIFYHMPSGLVLYWLVNSTLMFLYQMRVKRGI